MRRWISATIAAAAVALACTACTSPAPVAPSSSAPAEARPTPSTSPTGPRTTVAVLGDSLSRGYNACDHFGDCPAASWAGGTDASVRSVASRLGALVDGPVSVVNVAESGAKTTALAAQAQKAIAAKPDLATVLIGANDVCTGTLAEMTSTEEYASQVSSALQQLVLLSPTTTVLVASVPDVTAILPAASGNEAARFLWSHGGCATVLADPQSTDADAVARRAAVSNRIREYDAALVGACGALPRCVYDGGALHDYTPTLRQLSALDRFHPSIAGLREVADVEWKALTASDRSASLLAR